VARVGESIGDGKSVHSCPLESGTIPVILGKDPASAESRAASCCAEIRQLMRTMAQDGWGAPRIHAELTKLGFVLSEITVSRYLPRCPVEPDQVKRWVAFLLNHKDEIASMDLFAVPSVSLRVLYGFFIIGHGRRRILHFNASFHPTAEWIIRQLREAFPYDTAPRYLIFDRNSTFCAAVVDFIKAMGTKLVRISYRSP
jgi:putative transposase